MQQESIRPKRFFVWLFIVACVLCTLWILVGSNLTIEDIKKIGAAANHVAEGRPALVFISLAAVQAFGMSLGLPTKALLTLLAGALLGIAWGSLATLVGVLAGTAALFLAVRYLLKDRISRHFGERAGEIEKRVSERPVRTMIGLRLCIALPYGPCTIAAALSSMGLGNFLLGSMIGDIPVIALYAIAGQKLFALTSASEAMSASTAAVLVGAGAVFIVSAVVKKKTPRIREETR